MKTHWRMLPLNRLDGADMTSLEHLYALEEYRATGGMAGVVMAEPGPIAAATTAEAIERLCENGPSVDEIDWSGFDEALEEI